MYVLIRSKLPQSGGESGLKQNFSFLPNEAMSFLKICLLFDQDKRPSCQDLLDHPYFDTNFKQSIELELIKAFSEELHEKRILNKKQAYSENNTPEPPFLRAIKRDKSPTITPINAMKPLKSDDSMPKITKQAPLNTRQSKDLERFSVLFPDKTSRRDEESPSKMPSLRKLQKVNVLKSRDNKKTFEFRKQMPNRSRNPSMVYDNPNESFYRASFVSPTLSHRNRNMSKQDMNPTTPGERNSVVFPPRYTFKRHNENLSNM